MEVATTNNHHHSHHLGHQIRHTADRLAMTKQPQQQQQQTEQNNMQLTVNSAAIDASNNVGSPSSPFQREVREWQRIDRNTGALLSGRLEADRWINGPLNSYGKISDSQNISQPNGTQHTQRKQLEVLQRRTANGAVQVIRAQTVQTSSSRSWSSSNSNSASTSASASASASPICMSSNVGGGVSSGGRNILHNHNNNNNNNNSHFNSALQQHLDEANTHWLQLSPPTIAATVDISEVSTDDDLEKAAAATNPASTVATPYIVDDGDVDDGDGTETGDVLFDYSISRNGSAGSASSGGGNKGQAMSGARLLPQPLPLPSSSTSTSSSASTLHLQSSPRLLPDTAPSLKLSNLMKSGSSGSNSSSSNNSTTMNTHKSSVGKVSLHAIVGGGGGDDNSSNNSRATSDEAIKSPKCIATMKSSNGTVTGTKTWQQQQRSSPNHLEQATLYGQNSNSSKSRVGVADCDDCSAADDADVSLLRCLHRNALHQTRKQNQQSKLLEMTPTRHRGLESFRHCASSVAKLATQAATAADDCAKDDDLRLSTRQLRRQQQPHGQSCSSSLLQRSHSISTDDLSNEFESNEGIAESNEWRRVSKLRRSFQLSSSTSNNSNTSINDQERQPEASIARRPFDLPANSISVSRIRAELESGRRLTTAMRNNHVDLAALESILHGRRDAVKTAGDSKRNTLLTAESLKEIRGRLKKLSDESLYKDDFIAYQQPPAAEEHIEIQQSVRRKLSTPQMRHLTPEESPEITTLSQHQSPFIAAETKHSLPENGTSAQPSTLVSSKHTSHSLGSRQKVKDNNSSEWHSRRKSYGFEKMSPPDNKSMFRMDASTDSGLGRSGEIGNWSPTEAAPTGARATVIHLGEPDKTVAHSHYGPAKPPTRRTPDEDLQKRHSIAVDESQYVRDNLRKTSQVHLNGFYDSPAMVSKSNMQLARYESNPEDNQGVITSTINPNYTLFQRTQNAQKRVEFCKTEVHFAAESGRVNIVETDGKPPPTNNFRRRRRTTSGPLQSLTKSPSTPVSSTTTTGNVTHFGDDQHRHRAIASSIVAYKATLLEPYDAVDIQAMPATTSVTVSVQKLCSDSQAESSHGSYAPTTSGADTTDNENDDIAAIRGILKNKPIKPKPYHLGENIDSADALWGVQLKPVASGSINAMGGDDQDDSITACLNKSVAERVRIAERRHEHSTQNGYSTKINLSVDEPATTREWLSTDLPKSNIMSIELHSPQISLEKRESIKRTQSPPRAKPRTATSVINSREPPQVHLASTNRQSAEHGLPSEGQRESLKIVKEARGARKLREHELSYFGISNSHKNDAHEPKTKLLPNPNTNAMSKSKRLLPSRQRLSLIGNEDKKLTTRRHEVNNVETSVEPPTETKSQTTTKWQLLNDKPDLLRHSPIAIEAQLIRSDVEHDKHVPSKNFRLEEKHDGNNHNDSDDDDGDSTAHYYENITNEITPVFKVKSPQPYDRKMDLERDAFLLSDMNENADLTMKALSDEAAHKDRRRRRSSLHRRESTPLETIDEKIVAHKANDSCIAVKMSRGTFASDAKRNNRHTTSSPTAHDTHTRVRTSSQSSVESCPRSRSLSSEREYENINTPKQTRTTTATSTKTQLKTAGKQQHRSSSRESQRSARLQYSSGDEVTAREEQRVRLKSKRSANSTSVATSRSGDRRSKKESTVDHHRQHHSSSSKDVERRRAASSTTHASQREERAECATVPQQQRTTTNGVRNRNSKHREEHTSSTNTGGGGSAGRHSSSRSATEKTRSVNAGVRLLRSLRGRTDDATAHCPQHSSGHRSASDREREKNHDKEREKDKQSKSRDHTTNKPQQISSSGTDIHYFSAHSGAIPSKLRDSKKSFLAAVQQKQHKPGPTTTHSKNTQIINGCHCGHHKQSDQSRQQQHKSATSTHRKRSEHGVRERT